MTQRCGDPWPKAVRIIRSRFPPIDLFEDIADPRDWPLIIAAEQKTNPRLVDAIGDLDLVPPKRRVGGSGRKLSDGSLHPRQPGQTQPFQHRLSRRSLRRQFVQGRVRRNRLPPRRNSWPKRTNRQDGHRSFVRSPDGRSASSRSARRASQPFELRRRSGARNEIARRRLRRRRLPKRPLAEGRVRRPVLSRLRPERVQGRHLEYHWDGQRVDLYRELKTDGKREVIRIIDEG